MAKTVILAINLLVIAAALLGTTSAQTTYVVGDSLGWLVPPGGPIAYTTWAAMHDFTVGDILLFNFTTGQQDVARVTKEAYATCNSTNPISLITTGPANYTLDSPGEYYFIGTMDRHCLLGQKLAVNVTAISGPTASPAPSPPPSTPSPASPRAPVTYIIGDSLGWLVPPGGPIAYQTWAYNKTFMVGDILVFNFTTGQQDVARVTKEAYATCNSTNPISLMTTGPASYTLDSPGEYYFIGTMDRHCPLGQKLAINVTASSGPTASPAPHSTPTPASPRAPVTYIVGDDLGWLVPPGGSIAYRTWAYNKIFIVGDTLEFNFKNGTQDVAEVTKAAYEACDTNSTITVLTTSPARITLTTSGEHYFTSTYSRHCILGQQLAINVIASSTATSPSGNTTHSAPGPSANEPAPLPVSSAPSPVVAGFSVTLLAIAMAFFY